MGAQNDAHDLHGDVMDILRGIPDPEMPISIVDLGIVESVQCESTGEIDITILPTFVGCPALDMIRKDIVKGVSTLESVHAVNVSFVNDPAWTVDRITEAGRASLKEHGVTVPTCHSEQSDQDGVIALQTSAIACPFCGSSNTRVDSPFGPTRCRMIFYCDGCRNSFEHMRRV